MDRHQYCVILAGGGGNHFWPVTRERKPKQFVIVEGKSLLRAAYERCSGLVPQENILIVTPEKYRERVVNIIPELLPENLLLEPYARKTGPCVAYATYTILHRDPDAVMTVAPCDHIIRDIEAYNRTVTAAMAYAAQNDVLITLGVLPTRPDPGYGYIQVQGGKGGFVSGKPIPVKTFTEKPSADLAKVFVKSGEFLWNSGVFVWKASTIRSEMEEYMPGVTCQFEGWQEHLGTPSEPSFIAKAYSGCDKISIDYGVMEKTSRAWVYPASFDWGDIDSWSNLAEYYPAIDASGNVTNMPNAVTEQSKGNIIVGHDPSKLLVVSGLEDFVIIDDRDVLLICPKDDARYASLVRRLSDSKYDSYK